MFFWDINQSTVRRLYHTVTIFSEGLSFRCITVSRRSPTSLGRVNSWSVCALSWAWRPGSSSQCEKREHGSGAEIHPNPPCGPLTGHSNAWPSAQRTFTPWEFTANSWLSRCASEFSYFSTFSGETPRTIPRHPGEWRKETTNFPMSHLRLELKRLLRWK